MRFTIVLYLLFRPGERPELSKDFSPFVDKSTHNRFAVILHTFMGTSYTYTIPFDIVQTLIYLTTSLPLRGNIVDGGALYIGTCLKFMKRSSPRVINNIIKRHRSRRRDIIILRPHYYISKATRQPPDRRM